MDVNSHMGPNFLFLCGLNNVQIIVIALNEYNIPYPKVMDVINTAFGWCNLSALQLVRFGCKVRTLSCV